MTKGCYHSDGKPWCGWTEHVSKKFEPLIEDKTKDPKVYNAFEKEWIDLAKGYDFFRYKKLSVDKIADIVQMHLPEE